MKYLAQAQQLLFTRLDFRQLDWRRAPEGQITR